MFKFTSGFKKLEFKDRSFNKHWERVLQRVMGEAVREFVLAADARIPRYTGMAASVLVHPGMNIARPSVSIDTSPINNKVRARTGRKPSLGIALSSAKLSRKGKRKLFQVKVNTGDPRFKYFETGDKIGLGGRPAWRSFEKGEDAFVAYLIVNLRKRIPKISRYVTLRKNDGV